MREVRFRNARSPLSTPAEYSIEPYRLAFQVSIIGEVSDCRGLCAFRGRGGEGDHSRRGPSASAGHVALHFPRVLVETPAPPALVERIGKETSLPEYSCVFVLLSDQLSVAKSQKPMHVLTDKFGRRISDLRISITDRCNYKCVYCRSGTSGAQFAEMPISDYLRMARLFVAQGITKVRLTGGEPLLRSGLVEMVRELGQMRTVEGEPLDIAITTNGHLLADLAQPLASAGLSRVTVSMDAVD